VKDGGILEDLEEDNEMDGENHRWTDGQLNELFAYLGREVMIILLMLLIETEYSVILSSWAAGANLPWPKGVPRSTYTVHRYVGTYPTLDINMRGLPAF